MEEETEGIRGGYGCAYNGYGEKGEGGNGISGREALFIFYGSRTGRALVSVRLPSCFMVKWLGASCITHGHNTVTYSTGTAEVL